MVDKIGAAVTTAVFAAILGSIGFFLATEIREGIEFRACVRERLTAGADIRDVYRAEADCYDRQRLRRKLDKYDVPQVEK